MQDWVVKLKRQEVIGIKVQTTHAFQGTEPWGRAWTQLPGG